MPKAYVAGQRAIVNLPAAGGETNTGSSLGGDAAVFKQKSGVDLEFRGLSEGSGITLTQNATDISIAASGGGGFTLVTKSGDQNFSTASPADVTDLSFTASANTSYLVRAIVVASTAGSTTGYGLGLNGPTGTYLYWAIQSTNGSTAVFMDDIAKAPDTALVSNVGSANELAGMIEGVVQVGGSGGTVTLRAQSENTNTITIHQESVLLYSELS